MDGNQWYQEAARRVSISEGIKLTRYYDSLGIPTIGIGYNLTRGGVPLRAVGIADPQAIIDGTEPITAEQALALLTNDLTASVSNARASLAPGIFDALSDARRFTVTDLVYNMGLGGWVSFSGTRTLINEAQQAKNANNPNAHGYFVAAGNHLAASAYYTQTGNRAKRNVAMLINGGWCDANGDGSDLIQT